MQTEGILDYLPAAKYVGLNELLMLFCFIFYIYMFTPL